jgi:hypothetical protein
VLTIAIWNLPVFAQDATIPLALFVFFFTLQLAVD